ncbi:hypothetical protein N7519_009936 [Penicillium mononematosum]|uniref:uncharacterized protein n=1 Tax=Penicillium mononematosum TaxID=268346 RepID=UPI0025478704|nr:uncharacterized protein N7519_009936 [Penicillium mononematosum]KAJ6179475.1 hypothetical protein N7519_009936 [Penicillium mononematosum]
MTLPLIPLEILDSIFSHPASLEKLNYNQQPYNTFLRAIVTNPGRAKYVEELNTSNVTEDDPCDISEDDIQFFQSVSNLSIPDEFKDHLNKGIKEGYSDAMLTLLLYKLPNLKNLFLYHPTSAI